MLNKETDFKTEMVINLAKQMCLAARTAPKGRGIDNLEMAVISGDDILRVAAKMKEIGEREQHPTFLRDSENVKVAQCLVVIGTKVKSMGLRYCGFCGFKNCAEAEKNKALCAFVPGDLGIAIGSVVAVAADHRLDNRLMYTVGKAVMDMQILGPEVKIAYGIPLSVSGKNPFFDRR
jgi:uncharacterized ferredoxin-like protein